MTIAKNILARSIAGLVAIAAISSTVLAAANDFSYTYSTDLGSSSSDVSGPMGAALASMSIFVWVLVCCVFLIGILFLILNIWMLIDVLKRTETELPNKTMWMVLLIIGLLMGFGGLVAVVYFFGPRKRLNAAK